MADRSTFNGASTNVPWQDTAETPEGFGNQYARHITTLYDASALPLTSVGGTGDNVTATVDPSLPPGGLRDGMKFGITWAATNSGPMTLTITGAGAAPVLSADGAVAAPGLAVLGGRALLEYIGGAFRVLSGGADSSSAARHYWQFTASGTWTKPAGLPDDTMVTVEAWGGGQSGTRGASPAHGGRGGSYVIWQFRIGDLPATVPVTIGAGGAARTTNGSGNPGGNTSFGSLLTALGGAPGDQGPRSVEVGGVPVEAPDAFRAGGAGWSTGSIIGVSVFGGDGGDIQSPGFAPAGGGGATGASGTSGAGARGEVRIWI